MIEVLVNGAATSVPDNTTITSLLEEMELTGRRIAVEVNQMIVPRSQHSEHQLQSGDTVEIVHAIGGG